MAFAGKEKKATNESRRTVRMRWKVLQNSKRIFFVVVIVVFLPMQFTMCWKRATGQLQNKRHVSSIIRSVFGYTRLRVRCAVHRAPYEVCMMEWRRRKCIRAFRCELSRSLARHWKSILSHLKSNWTNWYWLSNWTSRCRCYSISRVWWCVDDSVCRFRTNNHIVS